MTENPRAVRVAFRYQDGEILSPEREALSEDVELPLAVIDLGDGAWLSLVELRDLHAARLEADIFADDPTTPAVPDAGDQEEKQ